MHSKIWPGILFDSEPNLSIARIQVVGRVICLLAVSIASGFLHGQEADLNKLPTVLKLPMVESGPPAPGKRAQRFLDARTELFHLLYLPKDWQADGSYPVIVEFPGRGPFANRYGDRCSGRVDSCSLGFGLSRGEGAIWLSLPFVNADGTHDQNWWGDVEATKAYCHQAIDEVCDSFGGDSKRLVLAGFSRGAIACCFIGLHDDRIARRWRALFAHSHFEGEFRHPAFDSSEWKTRMLRLGSRPIWISNEKSTLPISNALKQISLDCDLTLATLPFPNHSCRWLLCDLPLAKRARSWFEKATASPPKGTE